FETALGRLGGASDVFFRCCFQCVTFGRIDLPRQCQPISTYCVRCVEQMRPTLLGLSRVLLSYCLMAAIESTFKSILQLSRVGSRQIADGVESDTQLGKFLDALDQLRARQSGNLLQFLAQTDGLRTLAFPCF